MGTRYQEGDKVQVSKNGDMHSVKVLHIIEPESDSPDYVVQGEATDGTMTVKASNMIKIGDQSGWKSKSIKELEDKTGFRLEKDKTDRRGARRAGAFSAVGVDGDVEFEVFKDYDHARTTAIARMEEDIEMNPNIVSDWVIEDNLYITGADKRMLKQDERRHIRTMLEEDGLEGEDLEEALDQRMQRFEDGLENPIEYFVNERGLYSKETLMEQDFIRIDAREAAETVVDTDGVAHVLNHYDGSEISLSNGVVAYRVA